MKGGGKGYGVVVPPPRPLALVDSAAPAERSFDMLGIPSLWKLQDVNGLCRPFGALEKVERVGKTKYRACYRAEGSAAGACVALNGIEVFAEAGDGKPVVVLCQPLGGHLSMMVAELQASAAPKMAEAVETGTADQVSLEVCLEVLPIRKLLLLAEQRGISVVGLQEKSEIMAALFAAGVVRAPPEFRRRADGPEPPPPPPAPPPRPAVATAASQNAILDAPRAKSRFSDASSTTQVAHSAAEGPEECERRLGMHLKVESDYRRYSAPAAAAADEALSPLGADDSEPPRPLHQQAEGAEEEDAKSRTAADEHPSNPKPQERAEDIQPIIVVKGFPASWTEQDMKLIFALYGGVSSVTFVGDGGDRVAHVSLKQIKNIDSIVEKLHNAEVGDGELVEMCTISCEVLNAAFGRLQGRHDRCESGRAAAALAGSDSDSESPEPAARRRRGRSKEKKRGKDRSLKHAVMAGFPGGFPMHWPRGYPAPGFPVRYPFWPGPAMGGAHHGFPGMGPAHMQHQMQHHPGGGTFNRGGDNRPLRSRSRNRL